MFNQNKLNINNSERARLFNIYHAKGEIIELKAPSKYGQFVRVTEPARAAAGGVMVGISRAPYFVNINELKTAVF